VIPRSQRGGRGFESPLVHQIPNDLTCFRKYDYRGVRGDWACRKLEPHPYPLSPVVRQNSSRDPRRSGSWWSRQTTIGSIEQVKIRDEANPRARGAHIYIRTGRKSIRTRPLDCNDGAARRVAPVKGLEGKPRERTCSLAIILLWTIAEPRTCVDILWGLRPSLA
jgi:hypothetical protein